MITDTQGRAWRLGVTDVAIGAAGVEVLADLRGDVDAHGNELVVTQVAVGDELAAAGDLVKGKLAGGAGGGRPRILGTGRTADSPGARSLIRARDEDLFRLGTDLAIEQGRREAVLLRRTVRQLHRRARRPDGAGPLRGHRVDRAGAAPHQAGAVRLGPRAPDGAAGGDAGGLGGRPGRRRLVAGPDRPAHRPRPGAAGRHRDRHPDDHR